MQTKFYNKLLMITKNYFQITTWCVSKIEVNIYNKCAG